jgi:threonine dehydrogenase-like Zn-dependent dehydrogenase
VGKNVTDIKPGDKVSVYPLLYDGTCASCKAGLPNICENLGFYGISGWGGGLSEAISVDRKKVYKLPPNMTTELGGAHLLDKLIVALCEPLAVGWHAVKLAGFQVGISNDSH